MLRPQAVKIWTWKTECAVIDFKLKGKKFGFNLTPVDDERCDLDFVPRNRALSGTAPERRSLEKRNLGRGLSHGDAWKAIQDVLGQLDAEPALYPASASKAALAVMPGDFRTARPRVGIMTLPLNANFGGNIQIVALADTLSRLGVEPVLLDRRDSRVEPNGNRVLTNKFSINRAPLNAAFLRKNIPAISIPLTNTAMLNEAVCALGLSAVIVGSDQVWRPRYAKKALGDLFLKNVGLPGVRKLSYAASFGADRWEYAPDQQNMARAALSKFDAVSCREDTGVAMCAQHLGIPAQHVLDPTLLVPLDRYRQIISDLGTPPSAGQILTYVLDQNPQATRFIAYASRTLGLGAFGTDGQPYAAKKDPLNASSPYSSPEHWIASFAQAEMVVTDSFHGTVFAVMFNRPFVTFSNAARGLARFTSFLGMLGLEDRLVALDGTPAADLLTREIDWDDVNARLDRARTASMHFLRANLGLPADAGQDLPDRLPTETASVTAPSCERPLPVLCTGCGGCVAPGAAHDGQMGWSDSGFWQPSSAEICKEALALCPFSPLPAAPDEDSLGEDFLGEAPNVHPDGGHYEACFVGYSKARRATSSSGGIATWVFEKILRDGHADQLFVVTMAPQGGYHYARIGSPRNIRRLSKTRYFPVTLAGLYELIERTPGRVAISGVACFVKSVRLRQQHDPKLRDKISFITGIICGGLKSRHYSDYLASAAGIRGVFRNADYREKNPDSHALDYFFSAETDTGQRRRVAMAKLGDMWGSGLFKAKACDFCTDVTTELADLSLGDAWLPEYVEDGLGTSVVVARSRLALQLIRQGMEDQELVLEPTSMDRVIRSQQGGYDHKRKTLQFRLALAHQNRTFQIPNVRTRVLTSVSPAEAILQILRERVRAKSHLIWKRTRDADGFDRGIAKSREMLQIVTRLRRKNSAQVSDYAARFLAEGQFDDLSGELAVLRPIGRWLRREISTGRADAQKIRQLIKL